AVCRLPDRRQDTHHGRGHDPDSARSECPQHVAPLHCVPLVLVFAVGLPAGFAVELAFRPAVGQRRHGLRWHALRRERGPPAEYESRRGVVLSESEQVGPAPVEAAERVHVAGAGYVSALLPLRHPLVRQSLTGVLATLLLAAGLDQPTNTCSDVREGPAVGEAMGPQQTDTAVLVNAASDHPRLAAVGPPLLYEAPRAGDAVLLHHEGSPP